MALSKEESARETTNLAIIAQIIVGPCTAVLQDVLAKEMLPINLQEKIESFLDKRHKRLTWWKKDEGRQMFSTIKENPYFNIPLLYACLRCICSIPPHKNKWGNFPDDQDRSLSANIERIYSLHKEYGQYPNYHLKDLIFEHDWKNAYETVKELEKHLGSDTKHQKNIQELKTCSMKSKEGKKIIKRLWGSKSKLADSILESEEEPLKIHEAMRYRRTEETDIYMRHVMMESESDSELEENVKNERTEPVTSKQLRELFNSFELKIPHDPLIESFASGIVHKDVNNLVTTVNSLSHGVVLPTNTPFDTVGIFEMEVVYDYDQLWVVKKDNSRYAFQHFLDGDNPIKVILITSKSLPIVKAKLTVYKKYKHVINKKNIFLQHEHEEFDDVAKLIAYQKVMEFCSSVESVINAFSVDLYKIVSDYEGKPLTANKITEMCLKAFNESEHSMDLEYPRSFSTEMLPIIVRPRRDWREWVATKIHQQISKKGEMECTDAWTKIWNACQKTVEDLGTILSGLEEFRTRVLPVDQNKQIDEWLQRKVIEDRASFQNYPSIIKCIAGQRDDKNVVKVYLSCATSEETKKAFRQQCNLNNTDFEFVNIGETNEMPEEINQIKALDREDPDIDRATVIKLKKNIREHTRELYARYSNIIGIQIGKRVHCDTQGQLCIILYCLDKTLIPFGEKKLPDTFAGCACVFMEDFFMLGNCTEVCKSADSPELGCSIGIPSDEFSGSVGFMYKSRNLSAFKSGFLTASHVAIKNCHNLHSNDELHELTKHRLGQKKHSIVHPSWKDSGGKNQVVGHVKQAYYGNNSLPDGSIEGLDLAVVETNSLPDKSIEGHDLAKVETNQCREEETVEIYNERDGILGMEVTKTGRETGLTSGELICEMESVNIEQPVGSEIRYKFESIYAVRNIPKKDEFFKRGDSGSGIFVVQKEKPDKALGIGIAIGTELKQTFVCKIAHILPTLELEIVRYRELNKEQTSQSTEEKSKQ